LPAALELTPDGDDAFLGTHQVIPSGRAYGGEIVAQAERAVSLTVGDDRRQVVWPRAWDRLPDDPDLHRSALTYVCDYTLLEPVLRHHGAAWATDGVVTASLDHAMWWHHDGRLPASVVQEGLVTVP
jgi:acyl-CoA thioesterase-2